MYIKVLRADTDFSSGMFDFLSKLLGKKIKIKIVPKTISLATGLGIQVKYIQWMSVKEF